MVSYLEGVILDSRDGAAVIMGHPGWVAPGLVQVLHRVGTKWVLR
jgi:hypothetical protein